jgi:hypothetical protein
MNPALSSPATPLFIPFWSAASLLQHRETADPLEIKSRQLVQNAYAMEQIFHSACPAGQVSRKVARFACGSLEDCLVYASKQYAEPFYVYEVEMPDAVAAPMALTGHARKIVQIGPLIVEAIAAEYWEPKQQWNYWEYLGSTMTILKSGARFVPPVAIAQRVQLRRRLYNEDTANAGRINWLAS